MLSNVILRFVCKSNSSIYNLVLKLDYLVVQGWLLVTWGHVPEDSVAVKNVPHTILESEVLGFFCGKDHKVRHENLIMHCSMALLCSWGATLLMCLQWHMLLDFLRIIFEGWSPKLHAAVLGLFFLRNFSMKVVCGYIRCCRCGMDPTLGEGNISPSIACMTYQ